MADISFGTPVFLSDGIIELPLTFMESVRYLSENSLQLAATAAPGDTDSDFDVSDARRTLSGRDDAYTLEIQIPPDRKGVLSVSGRGNVSLASSGTTEQLSGMASMNFSTLIPRIIDTDMPSYTPGARYDAKIAYNVEVTGLSGGNLSSVFQFEEAAARAGTPTGYKWVGTSPPNLETVEPDDLSTTDWEQLDAAPTTDDGQFDESGNGIWHGNEAQYYLIRWGNVAESTTGVFNMVTKHGTVRGPVTF